MRYADGQTALGLSTACMTGPPNSAATLVVNAVLTTSTAILRFVSIETHDVVRLRRLRTEAGPLARRRTSPWIPECGRRLSSRRTLANARTWAPSADVGDVPISVIATCAESTTRSKSPHLPVKGPV